MDDKAATHLVTTYPRLVVAHSFPGSGSLSPCSGVNPMVEWGGEVTLNFSVNIKRPRPRDYGALRVARPFARMHMSLRTYI